MSEAEPAESRKLNEWLFSCVQPAIFCIMLCPFSISSDVIRGQQGLNGFDNLLCSSTPQHDLCGCATHLLQAVWVVRQFVNSASYCTCCELIGVP
jgi:hypothetical protein